MNTVSKILIGLALVTVPVVALHAQSNAAKDTSLTDAQKTAVENVVRELLLKKEPELIVKAAQEMQSRMEKEQASKSVASITENKSKIYNDPTSQVIGNPKGDVTIVEFFDYQCGYCKMVQPTIVKLIEKDKNVRVVLKELPILGPGSQIAAQAALASVPQGKYLAFHNALMEKKDRLSEETVMETAKSVGLDVAKLKNDMKDPKIEKIIKDNIALASSIGANGTPAFVIADKLHPGAIQPDMMDDLIAQARGKK